MKGGSRCCRRSGLARWGHLTRAQPGLRRVRSERLGSGVERPYSAGIRSERVEALGAAGRTTWTPVVGLADETRRASAAGSAVYPSFARLGASRPPQRVQVETICRRVGVAAPNCCVAERRSEDLGVCQLWNENHRGVKFIRAQHYAGVDTFEERNETPQQSCHRFLKVALEIAISRCRQVIWQHEQRLFMVMKGWR